MNRRGFLLFGGIAMLDTSAEISNLRKLPLFGNYLAVALERIVGAVNNLGQNLGADPTKTLPAPPQVQSLAVKTDGNGNVHAVITHNSAIQKHINYFVEYDTTPNFLQPHVKQLGASRTMEPIPLPAKDDNGKAQSFYFRAYAQYAGGSPSKPVNFGGIFPTAVNPGGVGQMTLLASTGSGTAQASGQQGASGLGKNIFRQSTSTRAA